MPLHTGSSKVFELRMGKASWLALLLLMACGSPSKKNSEVAGFQEETCGSILPPSQQINIEYAVQQDFTDDGEVNGSWNANGRQADGVMVYNAKATAAEDYADDGSVNGSVSSPALPADRDDRLADSKDGKVDGIYCK